MRPRCHPITRKDPCEEVLETTTTAVGERSAFSIGQHIIYKNVGLTVVLPAKMVIDWWRFPNTAPFPQSTSQTAKMFAMFFPTKITYIYIYMYIYIYLYIGHQAQNSTPTKSPSKYIPKTNIIHSKELFYSMSWDVCILGCLWIYKIQNPIPSHPSPEARDVSAPPGRSTFGRVAAGGPRTAQRPGSGTGGQLHGAAPGGWG